MANMDFSTVSAALATIFEDQITNQINRASVLPQLLPVQAAVGQNITWDVRFGTALTSAVIADGADVATYNTDTKVPATLQFGTYGDAFAMTGKAVSAAMSTGNPAELANLFVEELGESVTRLAFALADGFINGAGGSNTIAGLLGGGAISATGTYATLSRSTYPQWAATVVDAASGYADATLQFDKMRDTLRKIYVASGQKCDLIACHPTQHEKLGLLYGAQRRYVQDVRMRGERITLDGGYQVLEFDGIPVVEDINVPDTDMLFLNTSHMAIRYLPSMNPVAAARGAGEVGLQGTPEANYGAGKQVLRARITPLQVGGDLFKFQLLCYPQIQVRRPQSCGRLKNLDNS